MNKYRYFFFLLLFLFVFCFVSCTNSTSYYKTGRYEKVLSFLQNKKKFSKDDYLYKALSLVKMGRKNEAKESVLLYMLMSDEDEKNEIALDLFVDFQFSSTLNVILLSPDDGLKPRIVLYKSYVELGDYENAVQILDYLSNDLSLQNFATLIVNFPCSSDYISDFFNKWLSDISYSDAENFSILLLEFSKNKNLSEYSVKKIVEIVNNSSEKEMFFSNTSYLSFLYQAGGNALGFIHDNYNSLNYYKQALQLDPNNDELILIIREMSNDQI